MGCVKNEANDKIIGTLRKQNLSAEEIEKIVA